MRAYWHRVWKQAKSETSLFAKEHLMLDGVLAGLGAILAALVANSFSPSPIWVVVVSGVAGAIGAPSVVLIAVLLAKLVCVPVAIEKDLNSKIATSDDRVKQLTLVC